MLRRTVLAGIDSVGGETAAPESTELFLLGLVHVSLMPMGSSLTAKQYKLACLGNKPSPGGNLGTKLFVEGMS